MKTYKLIAICIASLFFGACSDGLDEAVGLHVKVATNENVSFDGQIITAKKGTPIEFILSGDPDFLTFFSGEAGSKYEYRERHWRNTYISPTNSPDYTRIISKLTLCL